MTDTARPRGSYRQWADRKLDQLEQPLPAQPPERAPLTASQHILHLLLTIFTGGLWAPVWFIRAWHGNRARCVMCMAREALPGNGGLCGTCAPRLYRAGGR
jgi:hypothetical protein